MKFFNPCLNFPAFKIRDSSGYHGAIWDAGNASEFKKARENLGLNTKTFSLPSKVYLQYLHDDNAGLLVIKGFASEMTGAKQKSFLRKLAGFSPFLSSCRSLITDHPELQKAWLLLSNKL